MWSRPVPSRNGVDTSWWRPGGSTVAAARRSASRSVPPTQQEYHDGGSGLDERGPCAEVGCRRPQGKRRRPKIRPRAVRASLAGCSWAPHVDKLKEGEEEEEEEEQERRRGGIGRRRPSSLRRGIQRLFDRFPDEPTERRRRSRAFGGLWLLFSNNKLQCKP